MKHYNKYLVLILILTSVLMFAGCNNIRLKTFKDSDETENISTEDDIKDTTDLENNNDEPITTAIDNEEGLDNDEPTPTVIQPVQNTELLIYTVNTESELEPVTALVPADKEITTKLVVDAVVDAMADQSLLIGIENVTTEGDTVIVSFYSDKAPLNNVGSGFEIAILNAIAQSLTENLDDINKVIYRVEGGPYSSGHIELDIDEVYHED